MQLLKCLWKQIYIFILTTNLSLVLYLELSLRTSYCFFLDNCNVHQNTFKYIEVESLLKQLMRSALLYNK